MTMIEQALAQPRSKESLRPTVDGGAMRRACGNYATGVAIVSALRTDAPPCAHTINSFSSVSLDPPLVLWSLRADSPSIRHFERGPFAISILAEGQDDVARRFAQPIEDKFEGIAHRRGQLGAPIVDGSVAHLECLPHQHVAAGDHIIFIWHVVAVSQSLMHTPLAFYQGAFHRIARLEPAADGEAQVA